MIYKNRIFFCNADVNHILMHQATDFSIVNITISGNMIIKYKLNNETGYVRSSINGLGILLLLDLFQNELLWNIEYLYFETSYSSGLNLKLSINENYIKNYIESPTLGLNYFIGYLNTKNLDTMDLSIANKSIIPYLEIKEPSNDFKLELYDYQKRTLGKMINMENNLNNSLVEYTIQASILSHEILFDPIDNKKVSESLYFRIKSQGGILADEMGLGKTISSIALIDSNPRIITENFTNNKINTKATLIICPSHLIKQWESEINRCNPKLKVLSILTSKNYHLIFNDFLINDIIITSFQFLINFKFYPTIHYGYNATASNLDFRMSKISEYRRNLLNGYTFEELKLQEKPLFEFFNFHRLIVDEGHEIFAGFSNGSSIGRSNYLSSWLDYVNSTYRWYISGTPFISSSGFFNAAKFINLELHDEKKGIYFDFNKNNKHKCLFNIFDIDSVWNKIINKICIRHRKVDVENQIKILGYKENIIWIKMTDLERQLYDSKKHSNSRGYLQQLCCHPMIIDSNRMIAGNDIDMSVIQDKLIEHHKKQVETYTKKITMLNPNNQSYHMLKKNFETIVRESKYMYTILEKLKEPSDNEDCIICMDNITNLTLTECGHMFCYDCITKWLLTRGNCPFCKKDLMNKKLMITKKEDNTIEDPLIKKYGSKLGKLISIIKLLLKNSTTRIIVFSQWDDMLSLVGVTLAANGIGNCFIKGNVWSKNSAIKKFKQGHDDEGNEKKVIMLSLRNTASGTNLTEATHIFFIEPVDCDREQSKMIEEQAIARACRVGQKHKIMLMRVLIENTIEEDIYKKYYNPNAVVSFEEEKYFIEETKEPELKESESKELEYKEFEPKKSSKKQPKIRKTKKEISI